jgi:hypothetical protein
MPNAHSRRRSPPATRRRALELLARSRDGATEAILLAHGVTVKMMVALIKSGHATAIPSAWLPVARGARSPMRRSPKRAGRCWRGAPSHDRIDPQARHSEPAIR